MSGLHYHKEIRTLLADDEAIALHRLRKALEPYPFIKIIAEANNGKAAAEAINHLRPDLVFLDVQMPGLNGLEVLSHLEYLPAVVFVTAYEAYAIKAFEKNSLDYLLKPVEEERLAITIQRVIDKSPSSDDILFRLRQLLSTPPAPVPISTLPVKTGNKITLVPVTEVCFFEARDKYVFLHTHNEEKLIDHSLAYLQDRLPAGFTRIHRSYIVNKLKIRELHKYFKGTYLVVMNDAAGTKIKTSYSYTNALKTGLLLP